MPLKIVYDRTGCIGAGTCEALDPEDFELVEDGLADLKEGEESGNGTWEKEIPEERKEEALDAAKSCPVNVIKVIDTESGEQLYP
ncbi:MAG: ferredoxin [Candidatus Nanohaloarchaeota archaeon QJJ-7]|nr:ferredoxin [Candidatus Nanohaloarchaeota archaeon QJJ-7]